MDPYLEEAIVKRLQADFGLKPRGKWLQGGKCPSCGKKELHAAAVRPWLVKCNRLNQCGFETTTRILFSDLFESWSDRFPSRPTPERPHLPVNPHAAADAYMQYARGFALDRVQGLYTQESFFSTDKNIGSATVRFPMPGGGFWERLIDRPERFGKQKANFRGGYGGQWWASQDLSKLRGSDELWITEGIFDALALQHAGLYAVSTLSTNNYPGTALGNLADALDAAGADIDDRPTLVWAFDGDRAGSGYAKKYVARSEEAGWTATAAQPPGSRWHKKQDWNELWQAEKLTPDGLSEARYEGQLLLAKSAAERGSLIYSRQGWASFSFVHEHETWWFEIDFDKYNKARTAAEKDDPDLPPDELKVKALENSKSVTKICAAALQALYFLRSELTDESWYHFRITTRDQNGEVQATFTSAQLTAPGEFKKRLFSLRSGALWTGSPSQLDRLLERWSQGIKQVSTIDFVGYSHAHKAWVFPTLALSGGKAYEQNDEEFFEIGRLSIKTLSRSTKLVLNPKLDEHDGEWFEKLTLCFGTRGLVALAYFMGTLFAEQIRDRFESWPFLEIVGEAGSGKTTLVETLWKLLGRDSYEGFDPMKGSQVGFLRSLAQVSNLPVVIIESDRDDDADGGKGASRKSFHWDSLKSLYNGGSLRTTGVKSSGNDTHDPQFRAALVIAQNLPVQASRPIMERLVHLWFDKSRQTMAGREAALDLGRLSAKDLSGFLVKAVCAEDRVMKQLEAKQREYELMIESAGVRNLRIQKNHAQLAVMVDCLKAATPITQQQVDDTKALIVEMAKEREEALSLEHPVVEAFWETFDFLDAPVHDDDGTGWTLGTLNHSQDPEFIAVNLNHFVQLASERRQQIPPLSDLKRLLKGSRARRFIEIKTVNSAVNRAHNRRLAGSGTRLPSSVSCWIFKATR